MICLSSTADCYGKLCQTQPIDLQLRKGNSFVLCLTFCSAINSFNGSPQLSDICLLVQGLNKISPLFPFVYVDVVLDVIIQS